MPLGGPRIKVTKAEVEFLHSERRAAIKACPDLDFQRWRQTKDDFWRYSLCMELQSRDRDGSLIARFVIIRRGTKKRYIRKIRGHHSIGSPSGRVLELRRMENPG